MLEEFKTIQKRNKRQAARLIEGSTLVRKNPKKKNRYQICCQHIIDGKQCNSFAMENSLFCNPHARYSTAKVKLQKAVVKANEAAGKYTGARVGILRDELKEIDKVPEKELLDIGKDIKLSEAIVSKLTSQQEVKAEDLIGTKYQGKLIKDIGRAQKVAEEKNLKILRSLQYSVMNNASLKKIYFDVKFSDTNMVTKALYKYTINMIIQIIIEEVKDTETIDKVSKRVRQLGTDIQLGNTPVK
jgi:hypothetical protein